jgi:DNA repair protein RadC
MSKRGRIRDLTNVETIYTARIKTLRVKLRAAFADFPEEELRILSNPMEVAPVLSAIFGVLSDEQEHFVILVLNVANELVGFSVIASGRADRVDVDPKLVFRRALLLGAHSIILCHNHPAQKATPSPHDVALTGMLVIAGRVIEIDVLDHIIYTRNEQLSMRETFPQLFEPRE